MAGEFVLDKAAILERLGGDEEIFAVMADMFLQDYSSCAARMTEALADANPLHLQREAHTIKSLLATFSDEEGARMALAVEQQAKAGEVTGLEQQVADVRERLRLVAAAVSEERRKTR